MITFRIQTITPLVGVAALVVATGCSSDLTGGNRHPVQLSFTTHSAVASRANRVVADLVVGTGTDFVLQKVQLVFPRLELDRTGTADCVGDVESDDDHENMGEDCEDVSRIPLLVNVPLDDALHPVIDIPLAEGTFSQLEAKLAPARSTATDFNTANPNLVGKSVRVEGTFKGTPFVFTSAVRANVEMEFDPPLVIDATTKNATVAIDVRKWFLNPDGSVIDPTTATPESAARQQIEQNIRRSFHAFEDDDERGEDHHEGHNGNDDGEQH
jgi:hypothetical protein